MKSKAAADIVIKDIKISFPVNIVDEELVLQDDFCFEAPETFTTNKEKIINVSSDSEGEMYSGLSLSRLLSISNFSLFRTKSSVPWTFMDSASYFYLFISNFSISNFSLFRTKILVPFDYFSLYLELFRFTQQAERKCSIFENSNVSKTFEIQKFDCNQNIIKVCLN